MKLTSVRSALVVASILAVGALAPAAASANTLSVGEWSVGGIQQICLVSDGSWYSTTFSGWAGHWEVRGLRGEDRSLVYGNYASGVGNDSMTLGGVNKADWTEWRDGLVKVAFLDIQWTFLSATCGPPAVTSRSGHRNPMD